MSSADRFVALSKYLLSIPALILSLLGSLWKLSRKLLSKFVVLPTDTLSGKLFVVTLVVLAADAIGVLLYVLGTWQSVDLWVSLGSTVLRYGVVAFVIVGALFSITYPLDRLGWLGDVIVASGIRQRSRMSTGLIAIALGAIAGVLIGFSAAFVHAFQTGRDLSPAELDLGVLVASFVVGFVACSFLIFYTSQRRNRETIRTDLSIVRVEGSDEGERTVEIRNDSDTPVDLWDAKIADSGGTHYKLDVQPRLRPGETGTFRLPEDFTLDTIDDVPRGIAPFFGGKKVTAIYARTGDMYVLEWHDVVE